MALYHQTLTSIPGTAWALVENGLNRCIVSDGCFSRVVQTPAQSDRTCFGEAPSTESSWTTHYKAYKLTCCEPTLALFEVLLDKEVPGLPKLYAALGPSATDSEGFTFVGFELESLRKPVSVQENEQVERIQQSTFRLQELIKKRALSSSRAAYLTARLLAWQNFEGLGKAFSCLSTVIKNSGAVLDLHTKDNILFSNEGSVCLADPVALTFSA
jgi:hypothetical protein